MCEPITKSKQFVPYMRSITKKRKREMVIYSFLKVCENFLSTSSTTNATWSEDCGKKEIIYKIQTAKMSIRYWFLKANVCNEQCNLTSYIKVSVWLLQVSRQILKCFMEHSRWETLAV